MGFKGFAVEEGQKHKSKSDVFFINFLQLLKFEGGRLYCSKVHV